MRRAQGYLVIVDPNERDPIERDTFTCSHCNTVVVVEFKAAPEDLGGFCRMCMKNICKNCLDKGCEPFEKKLLEMEARDRLRAALTS